MPEEPKKEEKKTEEAQPPQKKKTEDDELRHIVRIAGKDLDGKKPVVRALCDIKGVNFSLANAIAKEAEKEFGIKMNHKLGLLDEKQSDEIEKIVLDPIKYNIPTWLVNRQRAGEKGETVQLTGHDLDFAVKKDIDTMKKSRSYKGNRHSRGLTVRGQRTKTSGRKGMTIGVIRKKNVKGSGK